MIFVVFWFIAAFGLLMALGTVLARNLVHAALYLVAFFFTIACMFVMLEADFLAAVQVLIYIGAVAILLLFGIMLTRNIQGDETTTVRWPARIPAAVAGLGVLAVLLLGINNQEGLRSQPAWTSMVRRPPVMVAQDESTKPSPARVAAINDMSRSVGNEMMTRYVIAFEVAGLLLTAALVGAIALAQLQAADEPPRPGAAASGQAGASVDGNSPPSSTPTQPVLTPASEPR